VARAEAYLHTKWHLDPSSRLATKLKSGGCCAPFLWGRKEELDPAGDEHLVKCSGRVVVERASDAAQLSELKETLVTDRGDVFVKEQIRRQ